MKKLNNLFTLLSALLLLGACEKDGDTYFLSSPEENELIASASSVVLTKETAKFYALSLAWTDQTLQVSDSRYQPTSGVQTSVQVSRTEDFSGQILETTESGVSKTYSVSALNIVAYQLKATPEEEAPLYFRLAGRNGSNIAPVYSNVVKVMVTPYEIDMRFANIINKGDGKDSGKDLYAANADGNYIGFMGATSWEGFYLQEADGTVWHTAKSGSTATPFFLTTDAAEGTWDLWFPGQSGCYYTNVNTTKKLWTALWMPTLNVSGIDGGITMEYKRDKNQWQGIFTATGAGTINIQMNGTGKLYDNTSVSGADNSIDDTKAKDTPFAFSGSANELTFNTGTNVSAGNITINVPAAGECTLIIDLNDPQAWKVEVTEGGSVEPTYPSYLEMQGADSWWGKLYRKLEPGKTAGTYRTVFQTVSDENFQIVDPSTDTWYGSDPNNLYSLALTTGEHYNIWFDGSGKKSYTIEVDYVNLTWKPTEIKQINVYGTFNGWSTAKDLMIYDEETGIWSAECDITTIGDGFYFLMNTDPDQISWDWRLYYTSESGLYLSDQNGDNIKPTKEGKYRITLDLNKMEFTMTEITE